MFDTVSTILIVVIALSVMYLLQSSYSRRNLPPFPARPIPILGNLLNLSENPRELFAQWRRQYGDVFSLYMGQSLVVFLNGYDAIKEGLVTNGNYFSDRPPSFFDKVTNISDRGIVLSSGKTWVEQRMLATSILRSLGMGKNVLVDIILTEANHLMDTMADLVEQEIDLEPLLTTTTSNVITILLEGKRPGSDDVENKELMENLKYITNHLGGINPLNYYPSLYHLPGDLFKGKEIARRLRHNHEATRQKYVVKKNYRHPEEGEGPVCFVDSYVKACKKNRGTDDLTEIDILNLVAVTTDLYSAGTETSSSTLLWCILYLLHYPETQQKIHKEIDSEIGTNRMPSMQDKKRLPLLNAFIMEIQRLASIVPLSVFHKVSQTMDFMGFTIPKGTFIAPNLDSVLHDPKIWGEDAKAFRPERHLDSDGKLVTRDEFIPFSIGKRMCIGEGMARMELFLFLTCMLQKFSFQPVQDGQLPPMKEILGITAEPQPYKVKITARE